MSESEHPADTTAPLLDGPSFWDFDLSATIQRAIREQGYTQPTPIQRQAIPVIIEGRDVLGCAQTGSGKTAAFALPVIQRLIQCAQPRRDQIRKVRCLVLTPTRELAAQVGESFQVYGKHSPLRHALVFGGVGATRQIKALKPGVDILVATPGRLRDLLGQEHVDLGAVEILVVDEADRMLDMGFLPEVSELIRELPTARQTLLFSATMPGDIEQLADEILNDPVHIDIVPETRTVETVEQSVYFVERPHKVHLLRHYINTHKVDRALVFIKYKHAADRLAFVLQRDGFKADAIHGDKSQLMREKALNDFRAGRIQFLVASDIASRGLDVDGVSHVINYDIPPDRETYVHRIGRTARAGAQGVAVTFCEDSERDKFHSIEKFIRQQIRVETNLPEYPPLPEPAKEKTAIKPAGGEVTDRARRRRQKDRDAKQGERPSANKGPTYAEKPRFRSEKQGQKRSGRKKR